MYVVPPELQYCTTHIINDSVLGQPAPVKLQLLGMKQPRKHICFMSKSRAAHKDQALLKKQKTAWQGHSF